MEYYIECRNVFNKKDLSILNATNEEVGLIEYQEPKNEFELICNYATKKYFVKMNPFKLKPKYIIYDQLNQVLCRVRIGVKIIHSFIESDQYYFVKAGFWKIKYTVYNDRTVIGSLQMIRKDKKRYYQINTEDNDFTLVLALFLLAQGVRIKALIR